MMLCPQVLRPPEDRGARDPEHHVAVRAVGGAVVRLAAALHCPGHPEWRNVRVRSGARPGGAWHQHHVLLQL